MHALCVVEINDGIRTILNDASLRFLFMNSS